MPRWQSFFQLAFQDQILEAARFTQEARIIGAQVVKTAGYESFLHDLINYTHPFRGMTVFVGFSWIITGAQRLPIAPLGEKLEIPKSDISDSMFHF